MLQRLLRVKPLETGKSITRLLMSCLTSGKHSHPSTMSSPGMDTLEETYIFHSLFNYLENIIFTNIYFPSMMEEFISLSHADIWLGHITC